MLEANDSKNLFERSIFLKSLSSKLKSLAYQYDLAVILINNVISAFSEDYKKSNKVPYILQIRPLIYHKFIGYSSSG